MKMASSDAIIKILEKEKVKYVFGVPGGHLLPFYDSMFKNRIPSPILTKNEEGASLMADGYAKVSGNMGVCCGTVGPGATNLVTGVSVAYMDSSPMMVITA